MSERDEIDAWNQIDAGFRQAVADDKAVADHAHVSREDLEGHMRDVHGVAAMTRSSWGGGVMKTEVTEIAAERESRLRAAHWNLHERGILPHKPTSEGEAAP